MKKITLLILFIATSIIGFSQTWNFNATDDGWTNLATTQTTTTGYWELTSKISVNNPGLKITPPVPAVDVNTVSILAITMKNISGTGPEEIRAQGTTSGDAASGNKYVSIPISRGDTQYQTYYIDFSGSKWVGTVDEVNIKFKAAGNSNFTGTGTEVFEIDKIEFLASIPLTEKLDYTFDVDAEGWVENNSTLNVSGGVATIVPDVDASAKITQNTNSVDADANGYMHILYKNESALNNQLRIQFRSDDDGFTSYKGKSESISTSMSGYEELVIDLTTKTEWNGFTQDFQIIIRDTNNGNRASVGDLLIERILFNGSPDIVLGVDDVNYKDDSSLTLYPNPVNDVLNINSPLAIEKVEVFNLLGQRTMTASTARINTADLAKGMYIIKVTQENDIISTKRFVKQ